MSDFNAPQAASRPPLSPAKPRRANALFRMIRTITALMLREISTTHSRSAGGYLWALADPILGIALMTLVFQHVLGRTHPPIGSNFPLFYASGYLTFQMYHDISNKIARSLSFSGPLLAYPAVTFVDALLGRLILNAITHMIVMFVVLAGITVIFRIPFVMDVPTIFTAAGLIILFSAGFGTFQCYLIMRFPVWERAWSIISRPLFLLSGVFYTFDLMPPVLREIIWWNPILHMIGLMRRGIYVVYTADYVSIPYVVGLSLGFLILGMLLISRNYRDLLERV